MTRSKITTTLAAVAASAALIFGATACGASDSDCQGDPGRVSAKDYDAAYTTGSKAHKVHHNAEYELTIVRADGTTYEKDVTSTAYNEWYKVDSKFPSVKNCKDGKAVS